MRKHWIALAAVFTLGMTAPVGAQSFDIVKVADGVYAAVGRAGVASNGAFIVNKDDVLVVDTHYRPSWARDLIAEIKKVTDKPVRYVVNSHWHNDHTQGNQAYVSVFGSSVEYVAQHNTREDLIKKGVPGVQDSLTTGTPANIARIQNILTTGKDQQGNDITAEQRTRLETQLVSQKAYLEELKQIQITLPTITFERSLVLHKTTADGSERPIHILFFGKGHTRGDVVVYLPREKVVVTGDLLTDGIPFTRDSYPSHWVSTLEAIEKLDWTSAITGHGQVQSGKAQIGKLIAYFKDVVAGVKDAVAKGLTAEQAVASIDLTKHAASFGNYRGGNPAAVTRAWNEAAGKIPD